MPKIYIKQKTIPFLAEMVFKTNQHKVTYFILDDFTEMIGGLKTSGFTCETFCFFQFTFRTAGFTDFLFPASLEGFKNEDVRFTSFLISVWTIVLGATCLMIINATNIIITFFMISRIQ